MSKHFFTAAFAVGLMSVGWVGWGFVGSSWLALGMTAVIGGVYLLGAFELRQFRATTAALASAMKDIPQPLSGLGDWLDRVPPALRNAVRLRIEGERGGLPGPALTPYLVGLLVMLGMLGTFLGMVITFKGAVFALEGSADLQAIRSALAAPIKGLGLSFGASVAGVAASAMLGLMSAISRRERLEVARQMDGLIATVLRPFSLAHQRQETFRALQVQARALPEVLDRLDAMTERIERRSQQLDEQLLGRQAQFQREVTLAFTELAHSVGASLKESLEASARTAAESIRPVVDSTLTRIAQESQRMQERLGDVAKTQVDALSQQFSTLLASANDSLARTQSDHALAEQQRQQAVHLALETIAGKMADSASEQAVRTARLLDESTELIRSRTEAEARWIEQQGLRMDQLSSLWRSELAALRQEEDLRGQAAVDRLGELQAAVAQHLATLGAALEAPLTRLLHTASEVPQAAAGVIAQLRHEMSRLAERDNLALQERTVLIEQLGVLLQTVNQASGEQRGAIEAMLASASSVMDQAGTQFSQALDAHTGKAADMAAHITGSALELSSLAEAFGQSVQLFQASNDKLTESLQHIEASINRSTVRSDEQLAYYVAQAREVIDLSITSQQGLYENLRQLQGRQGKAVALADGGRE
jgi:pyruvate/2-oxoglutarate dehydrogenase complex dihydrolipoamide acyltransferase (E2) component